MMLDNTVKPFMVYGFSFMVLFMRESRILLSRLNGRQQ